MIENALRLCARAVRDQQWDLLADSPLIATPLIDELLSANERAERTQLGVAVAALLDWGIAQLKPDTPHDWLDDRWRAYNVLHFPYFAHMPFAELAAHLAISTPAVYQARRKAIAQLAKILQAEALAPQQQTARQLKLSEWRYRSCAPTERLLLALLAASTTALDAAQVATLLAGCEAEDRHLLAESLLRLQAAGLLLSTTSGERALTETSRAYFRHVHPPELADAHQQLARYWRGDQPLLAAAHYQWAGEATSAAELLLDQQRALVNEGRTSELLTALRSFQPGALAADQWARVRIAAGDLALQLQDVQAALAEYQQALTVENPELRALACYRRARAFLALNLDEALWHYDLALEILVAAAPDHPLRNRIQTDKAWFFIQEKPDLPQAARLLQQLETSVSPANPLGRSYLANAWAGYWHRCADDGRALHKRMEAWQLAQTAGDEEWQMHTARNLGNDYLALADYLQALIYFEQSRQVASQLGDRAMVALGEKAIGGCHFWLGDLARAARHYTAAHELLRAAGRQNWLASVCYDLAEVYGALWDAANFARYWDEGVALGQKLRYDELLHHFGQLAEQVGWLRRLAPRQQVALQSLKAQGVITKRDYQQITGCAQRQAVRDLNELCAAGVIARVGAGRAVNYVASGGTVSL